MIFIHYQTVKVAWPRIKNPCNSHSRDLVSVSAIDQTFSYHWVECKIIFCKLKYFPKLCKKLNKLIGYYIIIVKGFFHITCESTGYLFSDYIATIFTTKTTGPVLGLWNVSFAVLSEKKEENRDEFVSVVAEITPFMAI